MSIIINKTISEYVYEKLRAPIRSEPRFGFVDENLEYYLLNLLTSFGSSEDFFGESGGTRIDPRSPVALLYKEAIESSPDESMAQIKKLGDWLLVTDALYPEALSGGKSLVGRDYFVSMGKLSYARASIILGRKTGGREFAGVYRILSNRFEEVSLLLSRAVKN